MRFIKTGDAGWPQFSEAKKVRLYDETIGLEPVPREAALDPARAQQREIVADSLRYRRHQATAQAGENPPHPARITGRA